jgi:hypothetical protein
VTGNEKEAPWLCPPRPLQYRAANMVCLTLACSHLARVLAWVAASPRRRHHLRQAARQRLHPRQLPLPPLLPKELAQVEGVGLGQLGGPSQDVQAHASRRLTSS